MDRFFRRLAEFIESKYMLVIVLAALLVGGAAYGTTRISMESGFGTILPADSQVMIDYEKYSDEFGGEQIIVLVSADNAAELLSTDNLTAMGSAGADLADNAAVTSIISPAFLLQQAVEQITAMSALPSPPIPIPDPLPTWPPDMEMIENIMAIPLFAEGLGQVIVDNTNVEGKTPKAHGLIIVSVEGDMLSDDLSVAVRAVETAVNDAGFDDAIETVVTGGPAIMTEVQSMMVSTMTIMMGLAVAMLFLIIALIFKVRGFFAWRWLPLGVVVIGTMYTFGVMGYISVPLTMASMAVFPVLLGLGIDYGIQVHNRYNEEGTNKSAARAIIDTITSMGPVVGIALIASCLGLCGMFFSPIPMVRDFALLLIIGMLASYVVAMFPLPVILYWQHRREGKNGNKDNGDEVVQQTKEMQEERGFIERGIHKIAPWIIKNPLIILPIALIPTIAGLVLDSRIDVEFDEQKFMSENSSVMQKANKLAEVMPGLINFNILVEGTDVTDPDTLQWMQDLDETIMADANNKATNVNTLTDLVLTSTGGIMPADSAAVRQILEATPEMIGRKSNLVNDEYEMANIIITATEWNIEFVEGVRTRFEQYLADTPSGVTAAVTGSSILQAEVKDAMTSSRSRITFISIGFILAGLILLFRFNVIKALIATLPVLLIIGWSTLCMYALGLSYTPLTAALGALVIAIGVEFTILLMSRYYEERGKGEDPLLAMTTAMTRIGRAITASALTTIGGFAALLFAFDFVILQDFGIITMINVFFALAVTILVLPSLVVIVDRWRERRRQARTE